MSCHWLIFNVWRITCQERSFRGRCQAILHLKGIWQSVEYVENGQPIHKRLVVHMSSAITVFRYNCTGLEFVYLLYPVFHNELKYSCRISYYKCKFSQGTINKEFICSIPFLNWYTGNNKIIHAIFLLFIHNCQPQRMWKRNKSVRWT